MIEYWKKFPVRMSFVTPGKVEGTITSLDVLRNAEGEWPTLRIKSPDGITSIVNAVQVQLVNQLVALAPNVGDKIRITYHGPAKKAPPGLSPTKEFTVEVWPQSSPSQGRPQKPTSGKEAQPMDNVAGAGKLPKSTTTHETHRPVENCG